MNYIKLHEGKCWRWTQDHVVRCRGLFDDKLGILTFDGRRRTDKGINLNRELVPEDTRRIVREHTSSVSVYYHGVGGVIYYVRILAGMVPTIDEETANYILDKIEDYHCTMVLPKLKEWRDEWEILE